jgi:transcriptional regulator with XRE-family HTH domain
MFRTYDKAAKKDAKMKEAVTFVKQKLDSAKWFIDAIRQRQNTLLRTMNAIVELQRDFFAEGDEGKLKPMILKDIAQRIGMDISTVSRVANSKSIQTEFGIYPLKYFFSEGIATDSGEDASSREVKSILKELIGKESKERPLSDDKLEKMLNARGYNIARRTVAKYREQLNIPVARLASLQDEDCREHPAPTGHSGRTPCPAPGRTHASQTGRGRFGGHAHHEPHSSAKSEPYYAAQQRRGAAVCQRGGGHAGR